jgi:mRNA interferase RelE/StbE
MYQIVIEKQAQKQLAKISPPDYTKIVAALKDLANDPRPYGYKKLKGRPGYGSVTIVSSTRSRIIS